MFAPEFFGRPPGTVPVVVSAKNARLLFEGCSAQFIQNVCKGDCCRLKSLPEGPIIKVEKDQQRSLESLGAKFVAGIMQTVNARCVFFDEDTGFCGVHFSGHKPRSCIQSPFMLNSKDTLIVRNRYKLLPCYRAEGAVPAYVAFRAALDLLFGLEEAERICDHMRGCGSGDLMAYMLEDRYVFNKRVGELWRTRMHSRKNFDIQIGE